MSRIRLAAAGVLSLTAAACSDSPNTPEAAPIPVQAVRAVESVVPGEVIVQMKANYSLSVLTSAANGPRFSRSVDGASRVAVLNVSRGMERAEALRLAADPRVEYAEPNYLRQPTAIDPRLWAFYNAGGQTAFFSDPTQTNYGQPLPATYGSTSDSDLDAIAGIGAGGAPVVIGAIDTGVDTDHPEFTGRLILGRDWVNNDALPEDDDGHGSHTAGTMAGLTVGVAGVTGAAPNVRIHVQKVCGPVGCPTSAIVSAIRAAADYPGMVAMNLSLGGTTESRAEKDAIAYAKSKNVLVIVAAGNSGSSKVGCPACDPNAMSVSATTWRDGLAVYSQYGSGLDISAPGGEVYSNTTDEMGIYSAYLNGGYTYMQGTSMATPQVTGAAAVVASKTGLRGAALTNRLLTTADDRGVAGYDTKFGNGRLNVYRAITGTSLGAGL
ncbi:S8 family serine peptidase [Longimicrobium terrae]|uniref:Serine protease n=1 Tax=Longimicrobium terrae TaxID=1639882 RepID=A0A841GZ94_9BACT|nr:S8 family serine peptidase [Longimicrobium terrae]MBB4636422.1 subtilisin family serine protease [Longimicrobium terrae]MBB6071054.1 serine protease [Longimicrobium terrae]NNC29075.1 S8 family serine peptidase [Longimicrobium terrae]